MRARIAFTILAAAAAVTASAGTASATPHQPSVHASTQVTDRPDGGNGGVWADDTFRRDITITLTGGGPGAYTYTATLKDRGSFTTIKGTPTPNQGAPYAGDLIKSKVKGTLRGTADFSFTASSLPNSGPNADVATKEKDHGNAPTPGSPQTTSLWYEQAFPAGTTFSGPGIGDWAWTYKATVVTVRHHRVCLTRGWCWRVPVRHVDHQKWVDSSSNGDGNLPADGNIRG